MEQGQKTAKKPRVSGDGRIIAENMKRLRKIAGLTMQDIAACLNVTHQQVQRYESGHNRLPAQSIPALCDVLGVPVEALLNGISSSGTQSAELEKLRAVYMRIRAPEMREKILQIVDILAA